MDKFNTKMLPFYEHLDKSAHELLSSQQTPHSLPGIEVRPPPRETANKRVSHDKRNYGVGFIVNGIRS